MLADDIARVAEALNLDVRSTSRRKLTCMSPFAPGKAKLEIEVWPKPGKWNDWITGRFGDALGLVAYALGHEDPKTKTGLRQAILWAKDYFGLNAPAFDRDAWIRRRQAAEARAKTAEEKARRELAEHRKVAMGLWLAAEPLKPEDAGWAYLLARGIDLRQLPRQPGAIRFSALQPWHDEDGQVRHVGPALMSAMSLADGKFGSLHRTWIDPDQPGEKADLSQIHDKAAPRKMWPSSSGSAIRLWRGESGLSEREARGKGLIEDMVICEGVEDGLSIALMTPELRVAAAGSLPGILSFIPPKHVRCITVAADNDWSNPQAAPLLQRACERLATDFGKAVRIARSPEGKDFNDLLRERSA